MIKIKFKESKHFYKTQAHHTIGGFNVPEQEEISLPIDKARRTPEPFA
jgi:hypothetical protein